LASALVPVGLDNILKAGIEVDVYRIWHRGVVCFLTLDDGYESSEDGHGM
jgi:hypothetical protein